LEDIDVKPWLTRVTLDILGRSAFGIDFKAVNGGSSNYVNSYFTVIDYLLNPQGILAGSMLEYLTFTNRAEIRQAAQTLVQMTKDVVEHKSNNPKLDGQADLLDMFLSSHSQMSDIEVQSNIFIFFLAGHETTATALSFAFYYLAKYPQYTKIATEEVDRVLKGNTPTAESVKELSFIDMFNKEVMRISPPAGTVNPRKATEDLTLGGVEVPKGTVVTISIPTIHHLPEFWPEPDKFDPFRFSAENSKGRHPYSYIPFSLGRRNCIGNTFSILEQRIFLAMFLQKYTVGFIEEPVILTRFGSHQPETVRVSIRSRM